MPLLIDTFISLAEKVKKCCPCIGHLPYGKDGHPRDRDGQEESKGSGETLDRAQGHK